ncbi:hypothetical protein GCM10010399_83880 [Dactylosporangium fulvum]|uniref:Uncharacterized protein n=1 Tax=Dactylosporangium fulvum TaxID=53359 RepID=A0ABY5VRY2_9ACTN|nr:hypothetical protein [Dactylosporangium fulvum]UWP80537.1 hypothetical protein Dfulv_36020 [Dactylosporangium fulvum]
MSRASRVPLVAGLIAVVPAVSGVVTVLWATSVGVRNARVEPYLHAWVSAGALVVGVPAVLFAIGLLATAGLVLARRAAARWSGWPAPAPPWPWWCARRTTSC